MTSVKIRRQNSSHAAVRKPVAQVASTSKLGLFEASFDEFLGDLPAISEPIGSPGQLDLHLLQTEVLELPLK